MNTEEPRPEKDPKPVEGSYTSAEEFLRASGLSEEFIQSITPDVCNICQKPFNGEEPSLGMGTPHAGVIYVCSACAPPLDAQGTVDYFEKFFDSCKKPEL